MTARRLRRAFALGFLIASAAGTAPAHAQPSAGAETETLELTEEPRPEFRRRLTWRWPRFRDSEYLLTAGAGVALVGSLVVPPVEDRWHRPILLDEDVRNELALERPQDRYAARDVSDALTVSLVAYPILIDGVIVTAGHHRSDDVFEQTFLINLEVLAVTAAVQNVAAAIASRQRPYAEACGSAELESDTRDCSRNDRYRSFFSSHSSLAFASAGLVCSHHANLELYGGGAPDVAACVLSLLGASAAASMRLVADMEHASDVGVGALWGSLAGFGLPYLLHYSRPEPDRKSRQETLSLRLIPVGTGAGIGGEF